jgi:hypothetical protein
LIAAAVTPRGRPFLPAALRDANTDLDPRAAAPSEKLQSRH